MPREEDAQKPRWLDRRSLFLSAVLTISIAIVLATLESRLIHWLVLPAVLCGILIGEDAIDWFRGRLDLYDPAGIVGLLGYHFFFLAPLLHVYYDFWTIREPFTNKPEWLGLMAILNLIGLLLYRLVRAHMNRREISLGLETRWELQPRQFRNILLAALAIAAVTQVYIYARFGGIMGYVTAYTLRYEGGGFGGMGKFFLVAESFPILLMMGFVVFAARRKKWRSWLAIGAVFALFVILQFLFGGLRGSRSNVVWAILWAVGLIHLFLRPIPRLSVLVGIAALIGLMTIYAYYKYLGAQVTQIQSLQEGRMLAQESPHSPLRVLLLDLARADLHAFLAYRLWGTSARYDYGLGRTYLAALTIPIPSSVWPNAPPRKVYEGTELMRGKGAYKENLYESSRIYGLSGEVMLNFGPIAVPFGMALYGFVVGLVRKWYRKWRTVRDSRILICPLLIILCVFALGGDSDNLLFMLTKNGTVPFLVLLFSSARYRWKTAKRDSGVSPEASAQT